MGRGTPRVVEYKGERVTVTDLAARVGIAARLLHARIFQMGWTVERAATAPVQPKRGRGGKTATNVPRPVPALKRRSDGGAYVRWKMGGVNHTRRLGRHGSAECAAAYRRFAADWLAGRFVGAVEHHTPAGRLLVSTLADRWVEHAERHYLKDGKPTTVVAAAKTAALALNTEFGSLPAEDFKPSNLRALRDRWVAAKLSRATCNRYTWVTQKAFKWAASVELIPAAVYDALALVDPLRAGRTSAPDKDRKRPVSDEAIDRTIPHLCLRDPARAVRVAAMVRIQRLAGMRPGEVASLRVADLDTAGDVWRYSVRSHKNTHRGKRQVYYLGPKAVAILKPFLDGADPDKPLFGETAASYSSAVKLASIRAGSAWTPHQLRHALATAVAEKFRTIEHAAAAIGDTAAVAEAVYVHLDPKERAKIEVARAMG